ncbi:GDYXXLXY domain-containing protein [Cohnella sp.]|uniref:GDYXXLXY domain-containing protein n=1 Tax=Cohnella sp. TaxID=1883426 RepID=UPI0035648A5B
MLQIGAVRTGFLLGISLILAAIIYFFAANWGGLDRIEKSILSAGLVLLFYGVSFALTKLRGMLGHHAFLSSSLLAGGCISFGAAVALLGQIYNSHADSYSLFLVWSIPALLLAWITRYNPFYMLTYFLIHLALWFYFFPSSVYVTHNEETLLLIGSIFVVLNLILLALTEMLRISSAPLKLANFVVLHISLLRLSNSFEFETYFVWTNILCLLAIGTGFYYFIHIRRNKTYLILNALALSAFAVFKFIELAFHYYSFAFFFYGLLFVALMLIANVRFFNYLKKLSDRPVQSEEQELTASGQPQKEQAGDIAGKIVSTIVTVIGVIIGSASLCGVVFLASGSVNPQYTLFGLSVLFIILMIFLPRLNAAVRYTILMVGYIVGMISLLGIDLPVLSALFLILSVAGWIRLDSSVERAFTYALLNINLSILLFQALPAVENKFALIVALHSVLNAAVYVSHLAIPQGSTRDQIRDSGLLFTLIFLFWLTFFDDVFPYSYALFNLIFFGLVSSLLFAFLRRHQARYAAIAAIFWFVFLAFKYYDLLWPLLHKSVTLALLGLITLSITYALARRTTTTDTHAGEYRNIWNKKTSLILLVITLQLGFLAYQTASSERLLMTGTSIKLEITPIDPRSMLQGDYVTLNYSISTVPEAFEEELDSYRSLSKIKVILSSDERGVHVFNRLYRSGETIGDNEIVVNGKTSGWRLIYYGIETFFVPEGTGLEVERNARFAYVRVSADGDAVLEKLTKQ